MPASRADWSCLALEPTPDAQAIKRAYAAKLRVTRPDDDALAYQALREAYDRALRWARESSRRIEEHEQADEPAPLPPPTPAAPPRNDAPVPTRQAPRPSVPAAAPMVHPRALVQRLDAAWQQGGEAAWPTAWHEARNGLQALPLAAADESSRLIADWIIATPGLPEAALRQLCDEFGWFEDYRAGQQLGVARLEALRERVGDVVASSRPIDPELLARCEPVARLARLLQGRRVLAAWCFSLLFGSMLFALARALGPQGLRRIGVPAPVQQGLHALAWPTMLLRLFVWCTLLMATLLLALRTPAHVAWSSLIGTLGIAAVFGAGAAWIARIFSRRKPTPPTGRIAAFRQRARGGATGLGLLLAALLIGLFINKDSTSPEVFFTFALVHFACWAAGLWLAWPKTPSSRWIAYGGTLLALVALAPWLRDAPGFTLVTVSALWSLLSAWLHDHSIAGRVKGGRLEALTGWMLLLCAPFIVMQVVARHHGSRLALAPGLLVVAAAGAAAEPAPFWTLLAWCVATFAVLLVQNRAEKLALRCFKA